MANYKVPSQAASGADSFSDDLVGLQFTSDSSQMTGANFAIEKAIPEKDSKEFKTQPFSDFVTLDTINQETTVASANSATPSTSENQDIKFNSDKNNADRSLYGSLELRIGVAIEDIITKYPAAILADASSPIGVNNFTAENITGDTISNTTEFQVQYSLLYNPRTIPISTF